MEKQFGAAGLIVAMITSCAATPPPGVTPLTPAVEGTLRTVEPAALGPRIAGQTRVVPNATVRHQFATMGATHPIEPIFKYCIDERGQVFAVRTARTSGVQSYDVQFERAIMTWAYRPYFFDGRPTPVCSTTVVTYR